ncbi:hypothetical protein IWW38_001776 [Coemansia aciculifera]|uniref:Uncharacterized protein n=1 Tax=Coemansia aciculifera TaxID=417176 RepID=A0ACC1M721_9FUNG|nr:hypothetical protein IWW38_001776 [Coemansia aciculifera]
MVSFGSIVRRDVEVNSGLSNMYKAIYSLLVVVWIAIVGGVLYLAARRYRRNRRLRAQGLDPDGQLQASGGSASKRNKRLLDKDEILALPVITLTEDDIQSSKRLAHHHRPPSKPDAIPSKPSRASISVPTTIPDECLVLQTPAAVAASPVRAHAAISDNSLTDNARKEEDALALTSDPAQPIHEENCAVCLEDFNAGDVVRRLPCRHFFHIACIDPWLSERAATCPLCNFVVHS